MQFNGSSRQVPLCLILPCLSLILLYFQNLPESITHMSSSASNPHSLSVLYLILMRRFASSRLLAASSPLSLLQDNDVALILLPHNAAILAACETADLDGSGIISGAALAAVLAGPPLFFSPVNVTFLLSRIGATRSSEAIAYDKFINAFAIGGRAGIDVADAAKRKLLQHITKEKTFTPLQLMLAHGLLQQPLDCSEFNSPTPAHVSVAATVVTSDGSTGASEKPEDGIKEGAADVQSAKPHHPLHPATSRVPTMLPTLTPQVFDRASVRQFLRKVGEGSLNGSDVHALVHILDPGLTDRINISDLTGLLTDKETEAAAKKLQEEQEIARLQRLKEEAEASRMHEEELLQQRRLQLEQARC